MTKKEECAGSYEVSGYTRADGTEVSGYTRTCGSNHSSSSSENADNTVLKGEVKYNEYSKSDNKQNWIKKLVNQDRAEKEKFQRRADILYPNMKGKYGVFTDGTSEIQDNEFKMDKEDEERRKQIQDAILDSNTLGIFYKNYKDMKEANTIGADKYFHAKANCQARQVNGVVSAIIIDTFRELADFFLLNPTKQILDKSKKLDIKANFEDSLKDFEANLYGLKQGQNNTNDNCSDLVDKYRPNGLNEKY